MKKKITFFPLITFGFFFCGNLLVLFSYLINPQHFWPAAFVATFIPLFLFVNLIVFFWLLVKRKVIALLSFVLILINLFPLYRLIGFHKTDLRNEEANTLSVLSYNVGSFNTPRIFSSTYKDPEQNKSAVKARNWIAGNEADVICLQEFFNDPKSAIFSILPTIEKSGRKISLVQESINRNGTYRGLAILTSLPVTNEGVIFLSDNKFNGAIYVDVLKKKDTVRIVNIHLESMQLPTVKGNIKKMAWAFKNGSLKRSKQIEMLSKFIEETPYEVVLCGDFNDFPYSYAYNQIRLQLNNAFEQVGYGYGYTYKGDLVSFIRIDNQFYSKGLKALHYKTYYEMQESKHLPIETAYILQYN